ncbi:blackelin-4-like isoform X1 [Diaphorina citri]|uniref:Blackelin-4-like isoform X1 n=1 Tax=Diaphorina citri TaxID=121845 RepID=A0A1S3D2P3_DIACI|nr:blackelin-4-like isoform X1 [Diaphorina citri]
MGNCVSSDPKYIGEPPFSSGKEGIGPRRNRRDLSLCTVVLMVLMLLTIIVLSVTLIWRSGSANIAEFQIPDVCLLPPEPGLCRGYFQKFYFNPSTGQCVQFIYGGCNGNGNRFDSEEDCIRTCKVTSKSWHKTLIHMMRKIFHHSNTT